MEYYQRPRRWSLVDWLQRRPPKCSLLPLTVALTVAVCCFFEPATSQQHSLVNTPPILYIPDRNWRISETEKVGQIISRIRAGDPENDELVFGLEPHYLSNYANSNDAEAQAHHYNLPFRIDPVSGIVYLNDSLVGRGGENFFLYITVSDGVLTAKNEVFVNILRDDSTKNSIYRTPPSITSVVKNISQMLPAFDTLPGVQSVRNQQPNQRPSNNLPLNFGLSPGNKLNHHNSDYAGNGNGYNPPVLNFNPNRQMPMWSVNSPDDNSDERDNDITTEHSQLPLAAVPTPPTTIRIKLTPIGGNSSSSGSGINGPNAATSHKQRKPEERPSLSHQNVATDGSEMKVAAKDAINSTQKIPSTASYSIKATIVPVIIAVSGLFVAAAAIFGVLYRKRLCAISKTLKKKSKEEMAKKSNQSNLSSNLTDDSRNSMVLQHWNGPIAYGNRYVPWERDQQLTQAGMATSQLSTSAANGVSLAGDASPLGTVGGIPSTVAVGTGASALPGNGCSSSIQDKYDRWEFPRHRLKFFNILGEGAFGQVWRCEAIDVDGTEGISTVAVKTLKENAAEIEKKDLVSELEVMKSLEPHVNVVRLLGCCTDKDPMFVIIEYVNRGKLQTYLRNSRAERHYGNTHGKSNVLTSGDLTSFMYQIAKGMDYLTSRGIIHRDLAARNILITEDHTCKVADFGFARDVITSKIYERKSEGKLPIRWMATESLYDNIFSVKSDIWSFGILMWEIVTLGSTPYPGISAADVMRKVRDGYRLEKPEHCRRELYNIMYYCWSRDANERPTFAELVQMLDKLLHTEMDYIELERFPDHNYYNILNLSGEKL